MQVSIIIISLLTTLFIINGWWIPPSVLLVTMCVLAALSTILYYLFNRSQPYVILASLAILISDTFAAWAYRTWTEHGFGFSPLAMARGAFFLLLIVTLYGVFAYWRAVTAFRIKRGNVERERLVYQRKTIQEYLSKFQEWRRQKRIQEIYLPLGEKVETKD